MLYIQSNVLYKTLSRHSYRRKVVLAMSSSAQGKLVVPEAALTLQ